MPYIQQDQTKGWSALQIPAANINDSLCLESHFRARHSPLGYLMSAVQMDY